VTREPCDLVLRAAEVLAPLWSLLERPEFRTEVEKLGGYSLPRLASGSARSPTTPDQSREASMVMLSTKEQGTVSAMLVIVKQGEGGV